MWKKKYYGESRTIAGFIDNGTDVLITGIIGWVEIPFNCYIQAGRLFADVSGAVVVDLWKDNYTNYPPSISDSICASAKLTLSSAIKTQDLTLTGWDRLLNAGDIIYFNIDSVTTIKKLLISLTVSRI